MTRQELIAKCDQGLFRVNRMYLKSRGENGYWLYRILRPILKIRYGFLEGCINLPLAITYKHSIF